ncbi:MAG: Mce-associated rane protein [Pseudonocardiales bacterium]|jgi:Mce-associated membrane protein|nr:Mce-associated rane protein [Pseudonocardiales bacterium]
MDDTPLMTESGPPIAEDIDSSAVAPRPKGSSKKKARRAARERQRRLLVAAVIALLSVLAVAVVVVVLSLLAWSHQRHQASSARAALAEQQQLSDLRASAAQAAQTYAVDFSTYDYRHLDADFAKISAHLAPSFRKQYADTSASLKSVVVQYQGVARASIQGVGVTSVTTTSAVVVVFLDQQVTNSTLKAPRLDRNRLEITLERSGAGWLMSNLQLK